MKLGNKKKLYIYNRDKGKCFYCKKNLKYRQITLDHYFPLSKGGKDEVFNLVTCCKDCNRYKGNIVLPDYEEVIISLLIRAAKDGMILRKNLNISNRKLQRLISQVNKLEDINTEFVFQSNNYRFYVKDGFVEKLVYLGGNK